ncbi:MAG TPA: DUF4190 domain-containing protein [Gordonia sp. (in: high G+C Gram-positive bacteria)]|uniref:DUF4190 domain-containing protein n=1 Tax=unclassified Gordonia (in: high G+C Gram-positive bacteria) TaxID=2657482 RepID=UPI000FB2218D|nr:MULTISPECIES: DUF4190 domain-containing protein [unclassified Gordonia (in: high G+C Gram-positive bacteria)]RTL08394.1 MAG: hypothetical protein EKK62_07875 [Acidimicrobiia bacterium]HNP58149.1 DUF4190 domain-containing protein [Gordonia sp. (in: high G+C Gram-positive bacteria)]HRC51062.1 DUF4190 domain-containing protein [Gordonia sp. (in: high G+C Gram-positive bacteria)]
MSAPENPDEPRNDAAGDQPPPADAVYYSDRVAYPAQGFPAGQEQAAADYLTKPQPGYLQQSHDSYLAQWQKDGTAQAQSEPQSASAGEPAQSNPGYPAQPSPGYPAQSAGYPAQPSPAYPAQSAGYPAQPSPAYPAQSAGYPGPAYRPQDSYAAAYGSAYAAPGYPAYPVKPSTNGLSVAALCVGIVGLFLTFCFLVSGFVTGLAAILLGVFGLKQVNADPNPHGASKAMAIIGIVVGVVQILIAALLVVAIAADALN